MCLDCIHADICDNWCRVFHQSTEDAYLICQNSEYNPVIEINMCEEEDSLDED